MEHKEFELNEDNLDNVTGGTNEIPPYWGYGFPPHYLNACPQCGGGVYQLAPREFHCGPGCGWIGFSEQELASGYIKNSDV